MSNVICSLRFGCPERQHCGGAKPHDPRDCEPCPKHGKVCFETYSDCEHEDAGWCRGGQKDCPDRLPLYDGSAACERAL